MVNLYIPAFLLPSGDLILIPDASKNEMVLYSETEDLQGFNMTYDLNFALQESYRLMKQFHLDLVPVCVNDAMQVEWEVIRNFFKCYMNNWIYKALDAIADDNSNEHQHCLEHIFELQSFLKYTPFRD